MMEGRRTYPCPVCARPLADDEEVSDTFTYDGPITITHQVEDWGTVYVDGAPYEDQKELGTLLLQHLGLEEEDYEWKDVVLGRVKLTVEIIDRDPPKPPVDPLVEFQGPPPPEVETP